MKKFELKDYIKSQLGYPMVKVELDDSQLEYNIDKARSEMIKGGVGNATEEISFTMPLSAFQTEYQLPSGITSITDVKDFSSGRLNSGGINHLFSTGNILYNMGFMNFLRGGSTYNMTSYHLSLQYMDLLDKYTASKYIFRYFSFNNTLQVTPPPPSGEYLDVYDKDTEEIITIESPGFIYLRGFIIADEGLNTDEQGVYDEALGDKTGIQDYSLALSKITLGRIRSKFSGQTSIGNANISLDGDSLLNEGREDLEKLNEKLRDEEVYDPGTGIIIG